jgi:hypothetical protein
MSDADTRAGRDRVERLLIQPLLAMGLQRPRGQTVAEWTEGCARLSGLLCRMSEAGLRALYLGLVEGCALRVSRQLPPVGEIQRVAAMIEAPLPADSRAVRSFMASEAGRRALAMGEDDPRLGDAAVVELYRMLKFHGPAGVHWPLLRERAAKWAERVKAAERMQADLPDDTWAGGVLSDHRRLLARALPLVTGEAVACES